MCDQLGGGFSRYSVDAEWLVPHFEKMLYDNAQLVHLYLDAYRVSGEQRQADAARDILRYVLRDMTHPEGGFYSAEDADSEGKEGKFYCWTRAELAQLLGRRRNSKWLRAISASRKRGTSWTTAIRILPNQKRPEHRRSQAGRRGKVLAGRSERKMFRKRAQRSAHTWMTKSSPRGMG